MKNLALVTALVAAGLSAGAATLGPFSDSIAPTSPNWALNLTLPQFNPALGTLDFIAYTITADVEGSMGAENTADSGTSVTLTLGGIVSFPFDFLAVSKVEGPTALGAAVVDANFVGPDGVTFSDISASTFDTGSFNTGLAPYIGVGTVNVPVTGIGASSSTGGGSVINFFDTFLGASLEITYHYTPPSGDVPEPGTYFAGAALVGTGFLAYRRRRQAK